MTIKNSNNGLLEKMDNLLCLLVDHSNEHSDCCLKNILKIMLLGSVSTPPNNHTEAPTVGDLNDRQ